MINEGHDNWQLREIKTLTRKIYFRKTKLCFFFLSANCDSRRLNLITCMIRIEINCEFFSYHTYFFWLLVVIVVSNTWNFERNSNFFCDSKIVTYCLNFFCEPLKQTDDLQSTRQKILLRHHQLPKTNSTELYLTTNYLKLILCLEHIDKWWLITKNQK